MIIYWWFPMAVVIGIYFICALLLSVYGINAHILVHLFMKSVKAGSGIQPNSPGPTRLREADK